MREIEFSVINEIVPVPCIGKKLCSRDSISQLKGNVCAKF